MNALRLVLKVEHDKDAFMSLSLSGLSRAYSDNEPEYSFNEVKERNPSYETR